MIILYIVLYILYNIYNDYIIYIMTNNDYTGCIYMCVCVRSVTSSSLNDPMDCSPPGSSVHGILRARILERVDIFYSWGSSQPRDHTRVSYISCTNRQIVHRCATWEPYM